jgi:hypothetical protein
MPRTLRKTAMFCPAVGVLSMRSLFHVKRVGASTRLWRIAVVQVVCELILVQRSFMITGS